MFCLITLNPEAEVKGTMEASERKNAPGFRVSLQSRGNVHILRPRYSMLWLVCCPLFRDQGFGSRFTVSGKP